MLNRYIDGGRKEKVRDREAQSPTCEARALPQMKTQFGRYPPSVAAATYGVAGFFSTSDRKAS